MGPISTSGKCVEFIQMICKEHDQVVQLFARLDSAQRNFYDPTRFDLWYAFEESYDNSLKILGDKINQFEQKIVDFDQTVGIPINKLSDALRKLSSLQSVR
jgi:hypothetical protein